MALHFELVTPARLVRSEDVHMVVVPGTEGEFGVLEGHAPFMSTVRDGTLKVRNGFALTATVDILKAIAQGEGPNHSLLALGYSGWGPGQLESEIASNGWLIVPAKPELVFANELDDKWEHALNAVGVNLASLSGFVGRA